METVNIKKEKNVKYPMLAPRDHFSPFLCECYLNCARCAVSEAESSRRWRMVTSSSSLVKVSTAYNCFSLPCITSLSSADVNNDTPTFWTKMGSSKNTSENN